MPASRRLLAAAGAVLLSWGALLNTLLVTTQNLGDREDIRYINGGKIFFEKGAMWYHLPGLDQLGLAPQNIGGKANLRNNEYALFERRLERLAAMRVDLTLAEGAFALLVLDWVDEGTFRAVRLSALDRDGPFSNAVLSYRGGRVVERAELTAAGARLAPGRYDVAIELDDAGLNITIDGVAQDVRFDLRGMRPSPALGCGELDVTVHSWQIDGVGEDGRPVEYRQTWSWFDTVGRRLGSLMLLAALIWLVLFGAPVVKLAMETAGDPLEALVAGFVEPRPRLVYGLLTLVPFMPMVLQWLLAATYVVLAWMGLSGVLSKRNRVWRIEGVEGARAGARWWVGAGLVVLAVVLFAGRAATLEAVIGTPLVENGAVAASAPGVAPLQLGQRVALEVPADQGRSVLVTADVELAEGEAVRLDLLRALPPDEQDIFQVDRSSGPGDGEERDRGGDGRRGDHRGHEDGDRGSGGDGDHGGHGGENYSFRAGSLLLSARPGLPSGLRKASGFAVRRSLRSGWSVSPGPHRVQIAFDGAAMVVALDGRVVDFRDDLRSHFRALTRRGRSSGPGESTHGAIGGVQVLSWSEQVTAVQDLEVRALPALGSTRPMKTLRRATLIAAVLGLAGLVALGLGLVLLLVALRVPGGLTLPRKATWVAARAHLGLLLVAVAWLLREAGGDTVLADVHYVWAMLVAAVLAAGNVAILAYRSRPGPRARDPWIAAALALVHLVALTEGIAALEPEWRHATQSWWNRDIAESEQWMYDPMLRRLNPWFIDQRFKRRDYLAKKPEGRRVLVFGGSQTFGWGIPSEDRMAFSDRLAGFLHERGYEDVEVLNAAFPGVKTTTGLRWWQGNLSRYDADIVIVNFVVNEFMDVDPYGVWDGSVSRDRPVARLVSLAMLRRIGRDIRSSHLVQIVVAHTYSILEMESSLRTWVTALLARGVQPVFSIEPTNLYVESGGAEIMRNDHDLGAAPQVYRGLGTELGVAVYDPLPHFRAEQENLFFYDTMHMSLIGHEVFADHLGRLLASEALGPPPAPTPVPGLPE